MSLAKHVRRKTGITAALTATTRSAVIEIKIPGGKGQVFTLEQVEILNFPTVETVVNSGGLIEFENDSVDWKPFHLPTRSMSVITEGGAQLRPNIFKVNKPLPGGSIVQIYANPYDDQSQKFAYTIVWNENKLWSGGPQTYSLKDLGTAVTQVTIDAAHLTWTIPAGKAGMLKSLMVLALGTLETVVNQGALCSFEEKEGIDLRPYDFYLGGGTAVDAGGAEVEVREVTLEGYEAKNQAVINLDVTFQDNQSQRLAGCLAWVA